MEGRKRFEYTTWDAYFFSKKEKKISVFKNIRTRVNEARELPTYPSPKLTLTLTSHLGQNDGLVEG